MLYTHKIHQCRRFAPLQTVNQKYLFNLNHAEIKHVQYNKPQLLLKFKADITSD